MTVKLVVSMTLISVMFCEKVTDRRSEYCMVLSMPFQLLTAYVEMVEGAINQSLDKNRDL